MGIDLKVLDPTENCPAASVAGHVLGDFSDAETVRQVLFFFISTSSVLHLNICMFISDSFFLLQLIDIDLLSKLNVFG